MMPLYITVASWLFQCTELCVIPATFKDISQKWDSQGPTFDLNFRWKDKLSNGIQLIFTVVSFMTENIKICIEGAPVTSSVVGVKVFYEVYGSAKKKHFK